MSRALGSMFVVMVCWNAMAPADEPVSREEIRESLERGLTHVQGAATRYPEHRDCFSCHHQTLPVVAMVAARRAGVAIDEGVLEATVEFTADSFRARRESLRAGSGIGGGAMTVSYGLWTFWESDRPADDLTTDMVGFVLGQARPDGHWSANPSRPPLENSAVMSTVLGAVGVDRYATGEQRGDAKVAVQAALDWLQNAGATCQEDRNARLWGVWYLDDDECRWMEAQQAVLHAQNPDGGWGQTDDMASDAYATGQTLALLQWTGLKVDHHAFQRGIRYLLDTQQEDGSWFVATRSKPVQVYFDNGDPHGTSQFISTPATCWAVTALAAALEGR